MGQEQRKSIDSDSSHSNRAQNTEKSSGDGIVAATEQSKDKEKPESFRGKSRHVSGEQRGEKSKREGEDKTRNYRKRNDSEDLLSPGKRRDDEDARRRQDHRD